MDVCQGYLIMVVSVRLFLQPLIYIATIITTGMTINLYKKALKNMLMTYCGTSGGFSL